MQRAYELRPQMGPGHWRLECGNDQPDTEPPNAAHVSWLCFFGHLPAAMRFLSPSLMFCSFKYICDFVFFEHASLTPSSISSDSCICHQHNV